MFKFFRDVHIYLSLFFLPIALMYALTGVLYIFGFNQNSGATQHTYHIKEPVQKGQEVTAMLEFLKENHLEIPSSLETKTTKNGAISIGSVAYSAHIMQHAENHYSITTTKRSILGNLIMLHKAKAKWYFNILAVGFGLTLILLYVSGLMITLFHSKKNRNIQYATILFGIAISVIIGYLSVV